jgi:antitoxin component YwqK of YwqJK toxin-antitoxin module
LSGRIASAGRTQLDTAAGIVYNITMTDDKNKNLIPQDAETPKLCAEKLREAAFHEFSQTIRAVFPDENLRLETFSENPNPEFYGALKIRISSAIEKAPLAAEKLFYLRGLIGIIESEFNSAIKNLKCAGLLVLVDSRNKKTAFLYDMLLAVIYFITPNKDRLGVISDVGETGTAALAAERPHLLLIYEMVLAALDSSGKAGGVKKKDPIKNEICRYSDGKIKSEIRTVNGERDGTAKFYNASGKLIERSQWKKGHLVHCVHFNDAGSPLEGKKTRTAGAHGGGTETFEAFYIKGEMDGVVKCYLTRDGGKKIPCCEKNFKKGRPHGEFKYFSETNPAAVTSRRLYRDGEIAETFEYEKRGGGRETRMYFKDFTAVRVESYEKGELVYERDYAGDRDVTSEKIYSRDASGKIYLKESKSFYGEEPHGIFYQYGPSGNVICETPYKNGVISGWLKKYHNNGNIALIHSCHNDDYEELHARFDGNASAVAVRLFDIVWPA